MLYLFCLTKTYNSKDFQTWYEYHHALGAKLVILDNESPDRIGKFIKAGDVHWPIIGFPNQWSLFSDILNKKRGPFDFKNDDLIMFLDDDEYLWFDQTKYSSLECAIRSQYRHLSCLLIPEILMSTHHLMTGRNEILPKLCTMRRNDFATQGKAVVLYEDWVTYSFNHGKEEIGHVPWIDKRRFSEVVGSDVSKTTYGICKYDAPLRLYHYHIKSEADWKIKIERGSAATASDPGTNGSYEADITKNKKFGGYDIPDFTMKNAIESILS